nr:hypothetical protein BaRGS_007437 [Batillaria attramentaria]
MFNRICWRMLNSAFARVDRFHSHIQRNVKQQLPRRESERRNHQLSRHSDILSAVETRLSLLSMTYSKYIELDLCCFIPGKVLDELYRILRLLQQTDRQPPRAHEFLQELRDISSMAMEHFEEHVTPALKPHIPPGTSPFYLPPSVSGSSPEATRAHSTGLLAMKKEQQEQRSKISEQRRLIAEQEQKLQAQTRLVTELRGYIQSMEKNMELMAQQLAGFTGQRVVLRNTTQLSKIRLTGDGESREKRDGSEPLPVVAETSTSSKVNMPDSPSTSGSQECLAGQSVVESSETNFDKTDTEGQERVHRKNKSAMGEIFDEILSKPKAGPLPEQPAESAAYRNKGKPKKRAITTHGDTAGREEMVPKRRRR